MLGAANLSHPISDASDEAGTGGDARRWGGWRVEWQSARIPLAFGKASVDLREGRVLPGKVKGKVVSISAAGNLVTDIAADQLTDAPRDERLTVSCDEHVTQGLFDANHKEPPMTLLALLGEQGTLELCIVDDSAAIMLSVRPGEAVVVEWA